MVIARSTRELIRYIPESDRSLPADQQTTFLLAVLPNHVMLHILEMVERRDRGLREIVLRAGIRGWENFKDPDGRDTPFALERDQNLHGIKFAELASRATIEFIPTALLEELVHVIIKQNQVTSNDAKN